MSEATAAEEEGPRPGFAVSVGRWVLSALTSVGLLTAVMVTYPFSVRRAHGLWRLWGRIHLRIFGLRVRVEDRNVPASPRPPYLVVLMNQTSLVEVFVLAAESPYFAVTFSNIEFALIPFLGWVHWLLGGVAVVRQWPAQARRAAQRATRQLQQGKSLFISIEGRRSPTGALQPYKKGPVVMALRSGAPIIPLYILGARRVWPPGEWRVRPGEVTIIFDKPVCLAGRGLEERERIVAELEARARAELSRHRVP